VRLNHAQRENYNSSFGASGRSTWAGFKTDKPTWSGFMELAGWMWRAGQTLPTPGLGEAVGWNCG